MNQVNMDTALLQTDDLLKELNRRFPDMIFIGRTNPMKDIHDYKWNYQGDRIVMLGMGTWVIDKITQETGKLL